MSSTAPISDSQVKPLFNVLNFFSDHNTSPAYNTSDNLTNLAVKSLGNAVPDNKNSKTGRPLTGRTFPRKINFEDNLKEFKMKQEMDSTKPPSDFLSMPSVHVTGTPVSPKAVRSAPNKKNTEDHPLKSPQAFTTSASAFARPKPSRNKKSTTKNEEPRVTTLAVAGPMENDDCPLPNYEHIRRLIFRLAFSTMQKVTQTGLGFENITDLVDIREKLTGFEYTQRFLTDPLLTQNQIALRINFNQLLTQQISDTKHGFVSSKGENWKLLCRANLDHFTITHAVSALSVLAKQYPQLSLKDKEAFKANLKQFLPSILDKIRLELKTLPLQDLLVLPTLLSKIDQPSSCLLDAVASEIAARSQTEKIPLHALISIASVFYNCIPKSQQTEFLLKHTASELIKHNGELTPINLVDAACLFAPLNSANVAFKKVFHLIAESALIQNFTHQETLRLLQCFSRCSTRHKTIEAFFYEKAKSLFKTRKISTHELPKIVWAYAKIGLKNKDVELLFRRIASEASLNFHNLTHADLAYLALAIATLNLKNKETDQLLTQIAEATSAKLQKIPQKILVTIAHAFLMISSSKNKFDNFLGVLFKHLNTYMNLDDLIKMKSGRGSAESPNLEPVNAIGISKLSKNAKTKKTKGVYQDILLNLEWVVKHRLQQKVNVGEYCVDIVLDPKKKIGLTYEEEVKESQEKLCKRKEVLEKFHWTLISISTNTWKSLNGKTEKEKHLNALLPKTEFSHMFPEFNPEETEAFTSHSWKELFEAAKTKNLPTYCIAVTVCRHDNKFLYKAYDAISLRNYSKSVKADAAFPFGRDSISRLKILWIDTFEINCFQLNEKQEALPVNLEAANFKQFFKTQTPQATIALPNREVSLEDFALDGCNYATDKNEYLGRIQYIVGIKLLELSRRPCSPKKLEAMRWLHCAATRNIKGVISD